MTRPGPEGREAFWRLAREESGQALTEEALLIALLLGGLAVGGQWLMKAHPEMLGALDAQVRGLYFVLSLPFP